MPRDIRDDAHYVTHVPGDMHPSDGVGQAARVMLGPIASRLPFGLFGLVSFILAAAALCAATALLFEDSRRRTILPILRRGAMKEALVGDFQAQLKDVEHEAGVRRYL